MSEQKIYIIYWVFDIIRTKGGSIMVEPISYREVKGRDIIIGATLPEGVVQSHGVFASYFEGTFPDIAGEGREFYKEVALLQPDDEQAGFALQHLGSLSDDVDAQLNIGVGATDSDISRLTVSGHVNIRGNLRDTKKGYYPSDVVSSALYALVTGEPFLFEPDQENEGGGFGTCSDTISYVEIPIPVANPTLARMEKALGHAIETHNYLNGDVREQIVEAISGLEGHFEHRHEVVLAHAPYKDAVSGALGGKLFSTFGGEHGAILSILSDQIRLERRGIDQRFEELRLEHPTLQQLLTYARLDG
jgi:hypothetical protein